MGTINMLTDYIPIKSQKYDHETIEINLEKITETDQMPSMCSEVLIKCIFINI